MARTTADRHNRTLKMARCELRRDLYRAQIGRCRYCDRPMKLARRLKGDPRECTIDHVVPLSRGGTFDLDNLVAACRECNIEKGQRLAVPPAPPTAKPPRFGVIRFIPLPEAGNPLAGLPPEPEMPGQGAMAVEIKAARQQFGQRRHAAEILLKERRAPNRDRPALRAEVERLLEIKAKLKERGREVHQREIERAQERKRKRVEGEG